MPRIVMSERIFSERPPSFFEHEALYTLGRINGPGYNFKFPAAACDEVG